MRLPRHTSFRVPTYRGGHATLPSQGYARSKALEVDHVPTNSGRTGSRRLRISFFPLLPFLLLCPIPPPASHKLSFISFFGSTSGKCHGANASHMRLDMRAVLNFPPAITRQCYFFDSARFRRPPDEPTSALPQGRFLSCRRHTMRLDP